MNHKKKFILILSLVVLLSAGIGGFFAIKSIRQPSVDISISTDNVQALPDTKAGVISFFPIGNIDNLDQTVLVSFSQPMVPLKILDQEAKCPLTISPTVKGKCRRISTQTVEFTPDQRKPATKYTVAIEGSGENYTGNFTTPLLKWSVGQNESLREGIQLIFNFPVKIDQLKKYLTVKNTTTNQDVTVNVFSGDVPGIYVIKPKSGIWNYLTTYNFSLTNSLDSQEGNLPTKLNNISYTTTDSILNVDTLKAVKNGDNAGFEYFYYNEGYENNGEGSFYEVYNTKARSASLLPTKNVVLDVYFAEVIKELSPQIIRFAKNNVSVSYTLSYVPENIWDENTMKSKEVLTKKKIRITIKDTLANASTYKLSYAPDGINVISTREFKTAAALKVSRVLTLSYSKACLYTNNSLDLSQELVSISPEARIQGISQEEYLSDSLYLAYNNLQPGTLDEFLKKNDLCPAPKEDEVAYIINIRLNPSSKYQLTFSPKDTYGSSVASIVKSFTTGKIKDKDKYIYIGHPNKNTIPSNVPLVIDVQTINTNTANIDVCVMNIEEYLNSKFTYGYNQNIAQDSQYGYGYGVEKIPTKEGCSQYNSKNIKIKNKNWLLSSTKVDLEKDILGAETQNNIVRVSGKLITSDSTASTRNFSSVFVKSNLSLMLEEGENKNVVLATTYDGKPVSNLKFQGYKRNYDTRSYSKVSINAKYDSKKGTYEIDNIADVIVASRGSYRGMIERETDVTENYDFGYIVGQSSAEKDFLYLYTERPIYKPGDTVYFKGLLRNFNFDGFKSAKQASGTLIIGNELGNELMRVYVGLDKNSNFNGSFVLPKDMNLGGYFIRYVKADQTDVQTNTVFFVEEYKKPVFKVEVDSGKNDIIVGENINISINPTYYFGGKITNTAGNYSILAQKYFFDAKDYSDFQFGEGNDYIYCIYWDECNYMDRAIDVADSNFTIDKNGNYKLNYKVEKSELEQLYSFIFEVTDPTTQRPVSKTVSKVIHATDGYVGIQLPYWNTTKQGIKLNAITLDWDAQPKPNSEITVKLVKQDWKAIKKQGVDGVFYNDYSLEEIEEFSDTFDTDNKGILEKILMPKSDGEYKIIVSYLGESGVPFVSSQTVYVSGNDPLLWRTENNSITKVIAEKTMVNVGDNAQYTIQSPINTGIIFVAIEKDDGILDYFTIPLNNYATKLTLPIKKEYYPNIYVKAFLLGSQKDNPLPVYKRGLAISKVNTLGQKLDVKITTDRQFYLPGEKPEIEVLVTDYQGKPVSNANLSIGIVDQSLLALKGNPVKNPFAYFYDMKRYLGIITSLSLQTLVEKLEIKDTSDGSKGGDGGSMKGGNSKKKRGVFKDTAYRNANLTTNTQGIAKVTADALPDNLTTWVIESLVNTNDTKVGVNTNTIQTSLPLMINPNLPNMFSIDDKLVLHPVIFNKTDKEQTVSVSISGTYLTIQDPNQKVKIPAQGQVSLDFPVEIVGKDIPYDTQLASKVVISAITANTEIRDDVQLFVPLIQNATRETVTTVGNILSGSAKEALDIPEDLQGMMTFTYSKSLFGSLLDGISSSLFGTYGCLEQRFSTFMPHVYSKQLYTSAGLGSDYDFKKLFVKQWSDNFDGYQDMSLHNYIKLQLTSLEKFQNSDGGFKFRYDTTLPLESSVWLTNYIISSLANLRDLGYTVPDTITDKAVKYIKTEFYKDQKKCGNTKVSNPGCSWFARQAMNTISAVVERNPKDKEAVTMRELIEPLTEDNTNTTDMLTKAVLLGKLSAQKSSYKRNISTIIAKVLNEQLVMEPKTAHIGKRASYSNIIDTAYILEASSYVPELASKYSTIYDALQRRIAEQKKDGSRGSTQDTVNVIKALTRFISVNPIAKDEMNIKTLVGKKELPNITLPENDPFVIQKMQANLSKIDHNADMNIKSDSMSKSYYDLTMSYFLPAKDIPARYEGFVVKKDYYKYEDYMDISSKKSAERNQYLQGKIPYKGLKYPKNITTYLTPVTTPEIGQVLVTNMTITTSEPREQVAIENYIPAGAELINPHLSTESKYANNSISQQNNGYGYGYNNMQNNTSYDESLNPEAQGFVCDKEEFRTEKYFCYKENLEPGIYNVTSLIRMTHAGTFSIRPTMVFEFYHTENFGRTIGTQMIVK